jgi:cytochrome c oxidase assembly protein subunit 15
MNSNDKKINDLFINWLGASLILVFLIIIIGGLTRLTNSGLSITEWELFEGILPPLNDNSWTNYFNQYKEIPQYKLLNFKMSLEEFKIIYYWEYIHRILARIIGLFFLIPLIYFHFSKKIRIEYMRVCYLIFILIVVQGVIGWYMVQSGLVNDITVSHYRLSIHLITAVLIISILFWLIKNILSNKEKKFFDFSKKNVSYQILIFLIFMQIIIGAFVSGLDAGQIYQTWPLMGNNYLPNDLILKNIYNVFDFNNHSLVQFYHRNLAYLVVLYVLFLTIYIYKNNISQLYKPLKILLFFLIVQAILGIFTLISGLNIFLASLHQITSVLLVFSALNLYYFRAK